MNEKEAKKVATKQATKLVKKPELMKIEERYLRIQPKNDPNKKPILEKVWYTEFIFESAIGSGILKLHINDKGEIIDSSIIT